MMAAAQGTDPETLRKVSTQDYMLAQTQTPVMAEPSAEEGWKYAPASPRVQEPEASGHAARISRLVAEARQLDCESYADSDDMAST